MITLTISDHSALALQAFLYTADEEEAARHCTQWTAETLVAALGDVVVELDDACATAGI